MAITCKYRVDNGDSPIPIVSVEISERKRRLPEIRFDALLDTGSDTSGIPRDIVERHPNLFYRSFLRVESFDGRKQEVDSVTITQASVRLFCPTGNDESDRVMNIAMFELLVLPEGIIGRDVLKAFVVEFDGRNPNPSFEIR